MNVLTKEDSVELTVIEVVVLPVDEALAVPIWGIEQMAVGSGQSSASVFGVILTSYRVPSPKLILCIPETPTV